MPVAAERRSAERNERQTRIAPTAGKTRSAETRSVPTSRIATTTTTAERTARAVSQNAVRVPQARAKSGSKTISKIRFRKRAKKRATPAERAAQIHTSDVESVRMEVEPKSVEQTSPDTFEEPGKTFMRR